MVCMHCGSFMRIDRVYNLKLNDSYKYAVINYECPSCKIKVQFNNNPLNYGIIKTQVPCHLQPTEGQIKAMDTIEYYLPETKNARKNCFTKKLASLYIDKYQQESYEARQKLIDGEEIDYGNVFLNGFNENG